MNGVAIVNKPLTISFYHNLNKTMNKTADIKGEGKEKIIIIDYSWVS